MYGSLNGLKAWRDASPPKQTKTVRCAGCGRLVEEEKAYYVVNGPKKAYYCSKEEYEGGDEYRKKRDKFEQGIAAAIKRIVCYDQGKSEYSFDEGLYNTALIGWSKNASFEKMYYYVTYEEDRLRNLLISKNIGKITSRFKYINAVILNNIVNYDVRLPGKQKIDQSKVYKNIDYDFYKPKSEPRKNIRRSMEDLEDTYGS